MVSVVTAHIGVNIETSTAPWKWTSERYKDRLEAEQHYDSITGLTCSTCIRVNMYSEATRSIETLIAHRTDVLPVVLAKHIFAFFARRRSRLTSRLGE